MSVASDPVVNGCDGVPHAGTNHVHNLGADASGFGVGVGVCHVSIMRIKVYARQPLRKHLSPKTQKTCWPPRKGGNVEATQAQQTGPNNP
jgi:hypothetical protein